MRAIYPAAQKLVEAQRKRGLEPRLALRVGVPSREQLVLATRLVDLTGTNLRRAREILAGRQRILEAVAPALAMAAAVQIERAGGLVEFELGLIERLGFVADHPLRGMQACERLTIRGRELILSRGPLARPTEVRTLIRRGHVSELFAGFERERARWAAEGLCEADDEAELLARVSAREAGLEAKLHASKRASLVEGAEIYGDWLQAHGDPRGLVASASLALHRADERGREHAARILAQLVDEHASHLLGSLVHELRPAALRWLGPMLFAAKLAPSTVHAEHESPRTLAATAATAPEAAAELEQLAYLGELGLLERLLALPISAGLRELELVAGFTRHPEVLARVAAAACADSLEVLRMHEVCDLHVSAGPFSRLRRLVLGRVHGELRWGARLPALRRLSVEFVEQPDLLASFAELDAPALAHFELRLDAAAHASSMLAQLEGLFACSSFARLRSLTLRSRNHSAWEGLERVLARSPAAATLERVEVGGNVLRARTAAGGDLRSPA